MSRHIAAMAVSTLTIVACMLQPFLPGRYDPLAVPLSVMAQLLALAGLMLVPLGALWLVLELRRRSGEEHRSGNAGYRFAVLSIGTATLVAAVVALGALATAGFSLAIAWIALWLYAARRLLTRARTLRNPAERSFNAAPVYLIVVPVLAAAARFVLLGPSLDASRDRVMVNGMEMVADIESFREAQGHYPISLHSAWGDYDPGVIGVDRYRYEPQGEAYNLYFEHWSDRIGTREFIVYNPRDEQVMTSHDSDLLRRTPAELAQRRGYFSVEEAGRSHWRRFFFD